MREERFSRIGFILSGLGMAIGTGNIWRFPRVITQNGGGAFIIPWLIFLFLWCLPLLIIEISIGRKFRKGVLGSFKEGIGEKYTWLGAFIAWVSTAILFYYSVVVGWCIKYIFSALFNYKDLEKAESFWLSFTSSYQPLIFNAVALLIGGAVIIAGVSSGIEKVNKILIPSLFAILLLGVWRSLSLPGAAKGLDFLFSPNFSLLKDYNVWLNALSQAAWSTGAGWGLILTYAVCMEKKEDTVFTSSTIVFGDYSASILAGMTVVPTLFYALGFNERALSDILKTSNQGLTFISVPSLFQKIPMGQVALFVFFVALFFAAFTSLLSLIELPTRILIDAGMRRKNAVLLVIFVSFLMGSPSALSMKFFNNQDWTWGLALIVSGLFFSIFVIKYGTEKFRNEILEPRSKMKFGKYFDITVKFLIPLQFVLLITWWFYQSFKWEKWYRVFGEYSLISVILQWFIFGFGFFFLNRVISKRMAK
ncbi:MAG: sodium-dependent transporter [Candidatus Aminicenantia bacterium]